jgi:copper(I)-binding protein
MKLQLTALALAAMVGNPVFAAGSAADNVSVNDPYVRLMPPGQNVTGAFVVFKNVDDKDHKVVKADNPLSKATELHTHVNEDGMMKMRPVKEIDIRAGGETTLKPGSLHIMLLDIKQALKEGDLVPITVLFEDGSSKKFDAPVRKIQIMAPMQMDHDHGNMMH